MCGQKKEDRYSNQNGNLEPFEQQLGSYDGYNPNSQYSGYSGYSELNNKKGTPQLGVGSAKGSNRTNRYGRFDNPMFSEKSDMDSDNKTVTPKMATGGKRGMSTNGYTFGPFIGDDTPMKDADFESSLVRGMPSNTKKSYGFRNPVEHYFQYLDEDFQNADNSVEPFIRGGEGSRGSNKAVAKQKYTREIL